MGWSGPMPNAEGREVGYAVKATCDKDGCEEQIDRGLYYVCGDMHDGDEHSCGGYFCAGHLIMGIGIPNQMCEACAEAYERDHPEEYAAAVAAWEAGTTRRAGRRGDVEFIVRLRDAHPREGTP